MRRTVYISYWVFILFTNIFLVCSNFYVARKSNQFMERGVEKDDVALGKLKQRVIEVTMPEYKTGVSNSMDRYIELASRVNHRQVEILKGEEKMLNEACLVLAFLNLMLLVPFWRCYVSKRTNPPAGKIPTAGAVAGADNVRTGGN